MPKFPTQDEQIAELQEAVKTMAWLHAELDHKVLVLTVRLALSDPAIQQTIMERIGQLRAITNPTP